MDNISFCVFIFYINSCKDNKKYAKVIKICKKIQYLRNMFLFLNLQPYTSTHPAWLSRLSTLDFQLLTLHLYPPRMEIFNF